jgi:TolB-like protein/DNA-binding winged helix-turn-helix (wHTH) protein
MPDLAESPLCQFDGFLLDKQSGTLFRLDPDGHHKIPVPLGFRAVRILCLLVDRQGELVSQNEIMDAVWPNVAVQPNNLTVQLAALRRVLDGGRGSLEGAGSCIQNVPGRGYRFVTAVTPAGPEFHAVAGATQAAAAEDDRASPGLSETGDTSVVQRRSREFHAAAEAGPMLPPMIVPGAPLTTKRRSAGFRGAALGLCLAAGLATLAVWHATDRAPSSPAEHAAAQAAFTPASFIPAASGPTASATVTSAPAASGAPPSGTSAAGTPGTTATADRPPLSFVVLPFHNLGRDDGVNDATVDRITEDLTASLARDTFGFLVTARNAALADKGRPIDIRRVGQELGVRYAVEGSVRMVDGSFLRVSAQLVSAESNEILWAGRFDAAGRGDGSGRAADDLVLQIAAALRVRLIVIEGARSARERPDSADATDLLLRARAFYILPASPQNLAQGIALFERVLELDPNSVLALTGLAEMLINSIIAPADDATAAAKLRRAEELITRAELLRPDEKQVMGARTYLLGAQRRCPEVIPAAQRAIEAHPSLSGTHQWLGICLMFEGRAAEAIPHYERAIQILPYHRQDRDRLIGYALLFLARYDEAILSFRRSLAAIPNDAVRSRGTVHAAIAAAQALAGRTEEARWSAAEASRLWPTLTVRSYYPFKITSPVNAAQVSRMRDGLRLAGVRDHADEDADPGVPSDDVLNATYEAPTPTTVPGARTIRTPELAELIEGRKPLLILDPKPWGGSIPGAVGLWGAGVGGSVSDSVQDRLRQKMQHLTRGDPTVPVVAMGQNAESFQGRNLALRLVALGYTEVYWYRGGREAWEAAGLPQAELVTQDW